MSEDQLGPAAAYSAQVYEWLCNAYHAQMIQQGFTSYLAYQASIGRIPLPGEPPGAAATATAAAPPAAAGNNRINVAGNRVNITVTRGDNQLADLSEFTLPPIWKRVMAETLDFLLLFLLKVMVAFVVVDFFELVDLDNYVLPSDLLTLPLDPATLKIDYNMALNFTSEILLLEIIHRMVVCVFEALCTRRGPAGLPGGATPGKAIMGLKIVRCDQVISTGVNRVRVTPASDLGIFWAFVRSFLKNFSLAFLFPVCFSLMFLPYSRTLYDVIARSIVVENNIRIRNIRIQVN